MLNKRGIAFIPLLIWAAVILFTRTIAVKEKLITIDLSGNRSLIQKVDVTTAPSITLPYITLKLILLSRLKIVKWHKMLLVVRLIPNLLRLR